MTKILRRVNTEYAKRLFFEGNNVYFSSDKCLECHYFKDEKVKKVINKDDFVKYSTDQFYIIEKE